MVKTALLLALMGLPAWFHTPQTGEAEIAAAGGLTQETQMFEGKDLPRPAGVVGLLDLPFEESSENDSAQKVKASDKGWRIHQTPASTSTDGAVERKGIRRASAIASCVWRRKEKESPLCPYAESGYEIPAMYVIEVHEGNWYKVVTDDQGGHGWVQASSTFHPLEQLLSSDNLVYLEDDWDHLLYSAAGASDGRKFRTAKQRADVRVLERRMAGDRLWLRVEVIEAPCEGNDPKVLDSGWVPSTRSNGTLWVWFYSRGC